MTPRVRVVVAWLPSAAYMGLIWVLSGMPQPFDLRAVPFHDKGVHFIEYGLLAFLNARAARRTWPMAGWRKHLLVAAGSAFLWGYLDEIHQAFVPGRHAALSDIVADAVGALTGAAGHLWLRKSPALPPSPE